MIVDTGPLVAFLDQGEAHHAWIREQSREFRIPWITCEAVLAESWHLLRRLPDAQYALPGMLEDGLIEIGFSLGQHLREVHALLDAYRDVPMSLADACLVRMAELRDSHSVCTLDKDFTVYRKHRRQAIPVLMPPP